MPQTTLDQDAVNLAKAIRQTESGGNFQAKGKSGEFGAYQYTPDTWAKNAAAAGVNVPLDKATPEQQNEVAYKTIKALKDQGYNPGQIASIWNSGKPDAYLDPAYKGTNSHGAQYDVPAYAKSVATAYQTIKAGGQVQADPQNPSSTANTTPVVPPKDEGNFIQKAGDLLYKGVNFLAPSVGDIGAALQGKTDKSAAQLAADAGITGLSALSLIPGLGTAAVGARAAGLASKVAEAAPIATAIGKNAALGAGYGALGSVAQGGDAKDAVQGGLLGAGLGGGLGLGGTLLSKAASALPQRLARSFLPGMNEETTKYAVSRGLGSPTKMLKESTLNLSKLENDLTKVLKNPEHTYVQPLGTEIIENVAKQFPDAGLNASEILSSIKRLVPLKSALVDKLATGNLSLRELRILNTAIGKATYKTVFDDPAVKAGKEIGNAAYHTISDVIKKAAPESIPIFDDFTKELQLNGALSKAIRRGEKTKTFTLRDLMALIAGFSTAGPVGAGVAYAGEKALTSPTVNLKVGGMLNAANSPLGQQVGNILKIPALRGAGFLSTPNGVKQ